MHFALGLRFWIIHLRCESIPDRPVMLNLCTKFGAEGSGGVSEMQRLGWGWVLFVSMNWLGSCTYYYWIGLQRGKQNRHEINIPSKIRVASLLERPVQNTNR